MSFISYLINGVSLGSIYAIIALGYTMVYGIAKMLNFAHGDVIMIGCYIVFVLMGSFHLNSTVSIIAAVIGCTVLGVVIEKIAYKPLRKASPLAVLITAIGVSYFLQNFALILFGADTKSFTSVVSIPTIKLAGGDLTISGVTIATVISCIIIMAALMIFIKKSKSGQAMLAVSEDKDAAQLMGVNVNKTISLTFAIGSGLAAIAGVLLCSAYPTLSPYTGAMPGIKAFTAAVFGCIGSIPGALIGGILLGVIEILGRAYISSQLSDAIVFAVLIIVLLVKPTGLLGKQIQRIDVHIAIYQSNFSFCLLNQRNQQAERIINLPIKEDFLLRRGMVVDVPEHFVKALVRAFLIFKLFQFNIADTLKQKRIVGNKAAHLHKGVHNANRHLHRDIAAQYAGQHGNPLLRKGIGQIPTTTAPI